MIKVNASVKNLNQRLKQLLSRFFPGYIKREYFKSLDKALKRGSLKTSESESELLFVADLIPNDAIAIDVGANRGDYVFVLEKSNKCRQIFAVEPIPELNRQLTNLFPNQKICPEAISNLSGNQQFRIPYINSRYFDTRGTLENYIESNQSATRVINVETISLDEFIQKYSIPKVDLIKIDIEGHEYMAIQGAEMVLQTMRPLLIVEIEQRHHSGLDINDIFSVIQGYNYVGYYFDGKINCFKTIETFNVKIHQQVDLINDKKSYINNFIFVPEEHHSKYKDTFKNIINRFSEYA